MIKKKHNPVYNFLIGMMGGICLSLIVGIGLFSSRINQNTQPNSTLVTQPTDTPLISTPQPTPTQLTQLEKAELALDSNQPEKVKELLYPMIENWTSNADRIRGYQLLGQAELEQGHPQLAVPYFEKLYFYEPTAENLFLLATIYDMGGDIKNALIKYQELAKWENLPMEIDIEFINIRIHAISRSLGTPAPTFTLSP